MCQLHHKVRNGQNSIVALAWIAGVGRVACVPDSVLEPIEAHRTRVTCRQRGKSG